MKQSTIKIPSNPKSPGKRIPHWMIAQTVGCSLSTVKAVRYGHRSNKTVLGQRIETAEMLIKDKLINEVKELVQIK